MKQPYPLSRDLVLVGGGHSHALVLRKWGMNPLPGARLTLISPEPTAAYSGMLPGFVAGHYTRDDLEIDLVKLARFAGARFISASAIGIDSTAKKIMITGRDPIAFDVASINVGITSDMPSLPGFRDHAIPAKPLGIFAQRWDELRQTANWPSIAIIGGGIAGAELAMAMAFAIGHRAHKITLIDRNTILGGFSANAQHRLLNALNKLRIHCEENADVMEVTENGVRLAGGRLIESTFTVGAAGARPLPWLEESGVALHEGYVAVSETLQSSNPDIFAAGDCAHLSYEPRPKAGVFAVREAPVLYDNLVGRLAGKNLRHYRPQKDYLKLVSLGGKVALAEKHGRAFEGALLWQWKNRIDRNFMAKFDTYPLMAASKPLLSAKSDEDFGTEPICGGCGAKVGRGALERALAKLKSPNRADVIRHPGDDAAILQMGDIRQVFTTDHLSAVVDDPALMARIATVHALGDVWAMGATPQAATLSVILPRMSAVLQERDLGTITQVVSEVLTDAGAALVGGHTTQGTDLTIGLSVTGLCAERPVTLSGARNGDVLILTKPLGSGVILAADMRRKAKGSDILACHHSMTQPQGKASQILRNAHAMTDITGFGLAGHLAGIATSSGVGVEVSLEKVPLLDGALLLAESGVRSTLFDTNRQDCVVSAPDTPLASLMFDPQTCGGLLAAIAASQADRVLNALHQSGYQAAKIGVISEVPGVRFV